MQIDMFVHVNRSSDAICLEANPVNAAKLTPRILPRTGKSSHDDDQAIPVGELMRDGANLSINGTI